MDVERGHGLFLPRLVVGAAGRRRARQGSRPVHRLPDAIVGAAPQMFCIAESMSASVGFFVVFSSAAATMICPARQ